MTEPKEIMEEVIMDTAAILGASAANTVSVADPSASAEVQGEVLALQRNGYCVLNGVIPADEANDIRERVQAVVSQHSDRYSEATRAGVGFIAGLINFESCFAKYLADPRLMQLVTSTLGLFPRISFTSAIINNPGNERGKWHADWPHNLNNAGHIPAPYPDTVMHLTTLWMLSPFTADCGGTLILPGSHRWPTNPTSGDNLDPMQQFANETNAEGEAGSVMVMDSRLWHATAPNRSTNPRVALAVRYAPWWLNTEILRPGSRDRQRMVIDTGVAENEVPPVRADVYERLPEAVKPLYYHNLE